MFAKNSIVCVNLFFVGCLIDNFNLNITNILVPGEIDVHIIYTGFFYECLTCSYATIINITNVGSAIFYV